MKTTFIFFTRLTKGKKLSLLVAPLVALILSMKTLLLGLAILIFLDLLTGVRKYHFINKIAKNPLKKVFWKGTDNWDTLLAERAAMSGELVLSDFTVKAINKFRENAKK